jgi:UDP-glucose 4-epimerase
MKLVVTGGAGYIGSNVAALLIEHGHKVIVLDNLSNGNRDAVPADARFIEADIADFGAVITPQDGIDAVLHFAALMAAGESVIKPEIYWENNTVGSLKLLSALRELGIKQLIFSSTAAIYGNPERVPIVETAAKNPTNPYGMTKLAIDMAIGSECVAHGLAATSLRYFNVAGAYQQYGERHPVETHIIPLALAAADMGTTFNVFGTDYPTPDGTCIRDYIHIRDLAEAHVLALDHLAAGQHQIYNLGNGNGFSNREVLAAVEAVTGKQLAVQEQARRAGDPAQLIASSKLAQTELGWQPKYPDLKEIIADAWEFYSAQA